MQLYFIDEPTVTIGPASPPTVTFDNPSVTVSGQVTMLAPDGTVSDYQGALTLVPSWGPSAIPVTTDVNGDYQATVSPTSTGEYIYAQISTARGVVESADVIFNTQAAAVAVKAHLSLGHGCLSRCQQRRRYGLSHGTILETMRGAFAFTQGWRGFGRATRRRLFHHWRSG